MIVLFGALRTLSRKLAMPETFEITIPTNLKMRLTERASALGLTPEVLAANYVRDALAETTQTMTLHDSAKAEVRTAATAKRSRELGDWGEERAIQHLTLMGYTSVQNMNLAQPNHPFSDIHAERDGKKYRISVKTRNRYENVAIGSPPKENTRYKITPREFKWAAKMQNEGFTPAWMAIALDTKKQTYCCYFGEITSLGSRRGILMSAKARAEYTCFAEDEPCEGVLHLKNSY